MLPHRDLFEKEEGEDADSAQADHHLPNDGHAARERDADLRTQGFLETIDERDRRVRDVDAGGELGRKRCGELVLELILEDRAGDGDTPGLRGKVSMWLLLCVFEEGAYLCEGAGERV